MLTDVGLIQNDPLREDLPRTLQALRGLMPFPSEEIKATAEMISSLGCRLVICDIAPIGIAVAREAGVPSVLIENFLWDWIYEGYLEQEPALQEYVDYTRDLYASVDYHIQTDPVCHRWDACLTTPPISRSPRLPDGAVRQRLSIPSQTKIVVITMGGVRYEYDFFNQLYRSPEWHFIIPGGGEQMQTVKNVTVMPWQSDLYHPDLIHTADLVVGKVGYSTLAECYHAGVPFGYIGRSVFRESPVLAAYVEAEMAGAPIAVPALESGEWLKSVPQLLAMPRAERRSQVGADQVARLIISLDGCS